MKNDDVCVSAGAADRHGTVVGVTTSSQTIAKPNVKCSKAVREEITRILYQNSTDDSECMRIGFDKIQGVIDEIMLLQAEQ